MNLPAPIFIALVASWGISVYLALSLWRSVEPRWFKVVASLALAIPVFGPFLYFFLKMPPKLPMDLRATMNHYGQGGRFSGFGGKRLNFDTSLEEDAISENSNAGKSAEQEHTLNGWRKTGLLVAFILLAIYWTKAIRTFLAKDPWSHSNYWGQAVGTFLLIAILVVGSIAFLVIVWRLWKSKHVQVDAVSASKVYAGPTKRSTRTRRKRRVG